MRSSSPRFTRTLIASALAILSGATWAGGQPDLVLAQLQDAQRERLPDQLLVQFKPGVAAMLREGELERVLSHYKLWDARQRELLDELSRPAPETVPRESAAAEYSNRARASTYVWL